ncbi:hypothetical protein [Mycobacterium ulcerans]|uniref:hypothetical protein n=1 Tax=Mycobacterium ulcerans TaxID=1809 RepID=UPI000BBAFC08|nr:hypothetical protein [Mycobacterium ulcerans]
MGFLVESVTDVHGDGTVTVEAVDVVPGECEHFADAGAGGQQYVEDAQPVIPARRSAIRSTALPCSDPPPHLHGVVGGGGARFGR